MYPEDFSIKEVNAYYTRRGGIRTANVRGYANMGSFSGLLQRDAAQAGRAAQASQAAQEAQSSTVVQGNRAQAQPAASAKESAHTHSASGTGSEGVCCEQCHATNQLMLQMMSRNLYSQSALNYPLAGYGWTAYQNMADMLGKGLF